MKKLCTLLYMTVFCINLNKIFLTVTLPEFLTESGTFELPVGSDVSFG